MNRETGLKNPNAVAVIGMACRFPGAMNVNEFWHNLKNGVESISYFSEHEVVESGVDTASAKDPSLVRAFGVLEDIDKFDASFFGFTPREAELLDPQNRLFLECAWHAMEDAACIPDSYDGRVGVYASSSISTYLLKNLMSNKELLSSVGGISALLGNDKDHVPTRVSYAMNLKGPSIAVGTACSSSLVAIHLACQGLLDYHCDAALAGGVTVHANQLEGYFYNPEGIASPDGHCRTFDCNAGGTISGSGVGVVMLKRLEDAIEDGDNISAVVLSSAVNNDGAVKVGYTAPGIDGQSEVIAEAHHLADISPETISYVETHGTATKLGDPIEITALNKAFSQTDKTIESCALGSVKSNVGHLDSAAGVAGFIKTVLLLKNKKLVPSLHFEKANGKINIENSPFYISNKYKEWETGDFPRRAGVSSFAMGGTNSHIILEEYENIVEKNDTPNLSVIPVSAKSEHVLQRYLEALIDDISKTNESLEDIAYTFQTGRKQFNIRNVILAKSREELLQLSRKASTRNIIKGVADDSNKDIVFMFSGLGAHYINMGIDLYKSNKVFRDSIDKCFEIYSEITGESLKDIIYPEGTNFKSEIKPKIDLLGMVRGSDSKDDIKLDQTVYAHPAILSLEYSLAQVCFNFGIKPAAIIGHSIGEFTALCVSGALSLEDTFKIVIERARILDSVPDGGMLTVDATIGDIENMLNENLSIAAVNDNSSCVIAGLNDDLESFKKILNDKDIVSRPVKSRKAFHSKVLNDVSDDLRKMFANMNFNEPEIPIISNLTGDWLTENEMRDPDYWVNHTICTVKFYKGIELLLTEKFKTFLEIGSGQTLAGFVLKSYKHLGYSNINVLTSMKNTYDSQNDHEYYLRTLAKLWSTGIEIDWLQLYGEKIPAKVSFTKYPFEKQRYWIDANSNIDDPIVKYSDIGIQVRSWKKLTGGVLGTKQNRQITWIIICNENHNTDKLKYMITQRDDQYIEVLCDDKNEYELSAKIKIDPSKRKSWTDLQSFWESESIDYGHILYLPVFNNSDIHDVGKEITIISEIIKLFTAKDRELNIAFLLENAFNILDTEQIDAYNLLLSGAVRSLSDEHESVHSYCFEKSGISSDQDELYYAYVLNAIQSGSEQFVVAFRGNSKWIPSIQKLNAESRFANTNDDMLILGNNYRLVKGLQQQLLSSANNIFIAPINHIGKNDQDFISNLEEIYENQLSIKNISEYAGLENILNELCSMMAVEYLANLVEWRKESQFLKKSLFNKVEEKYHKFLHYLLRIAEEDKYLIGNDEQVKPLKDRSGKIALEEKIAIVKDRYPQIEAMLNLLLHAFSKYEAVFSGEIDNVDVFYNEGSELYDNMFSDNPLAYEKHEVYLNTTRDLLKEIVGKNPERNKKILEIGGGTGKLTGHLIADLSEETVEYHFTDIGKSFVEDARNLSMSLNIDFMQFDVLDISSDPVGQGFESSGYDIILAYDVIHATPNLRSSLKNIEQLLAPGGIVILIESIRNDRWTNMTWGLQTGWWSFNDERMDNMSPLIPLDEWEELLRELDMSFVSSYPKRGSRRYDNSYGMVVSQKNGSNDAIPVLSELTNGYDEVEALSGSKVIGNPGSENLSKVLTEIADTNGEISRKFLCEDAIHDVPLLLSKYDSYENILESRIREVESIIETIKKSLNTQSSVYIVYARIQSKFKLYESMFIEYLSLLSSQKDILVTPIVIDPDYFNNRQDNFNLHVFDSVSTSPIFISSDNSRKHNKKDEARTRHNTYSRPEITATYTKPVNDTEKILCKIWEAMFGIQQIGIHDNFFELGGDSLMATKIITRISKEFDIVIKIPAFFEKPYIEALAEKVSKARMLKMKITSDVAGQDDDREEGEI